jgi:hypothetical protein
MKNLLIQSMLKRRDALIEQVNDVLSTFRKLDPTVEIELLYRYCSLFMVQFYGICNCLIFSYVFCMALCH